MGIFNAMHGGAFLAHVDQVLVSSALNPGDMLAMDDLPPPTPCDVAHLFGLTIDEFSGHHDVSGGRHLPLSEFPLTAGPVALAADGKRDLAPGSAMPASRTFDRRTGSHSCRLMSAYVVSCRRI